jgi:hypothetical protein
MHAQKTCNFTTVRAALVAGALTALSANSASAQSQFIEHGTSGYGAQVGVATADGATGLSVGGGYSYLGFLDVGLNLSHFWFDWYNVYGINTTETGVMPYANLHILRQDDYIPVSLALTANFDKRFFSLNAPSWARASLSGWGLFLGAFTYRHINLTEATAVTPQLTLGLEHQSLTGGVFGVTSMSISDNSLLARIDGNVSFKSASGRVWVVDPFLSFDDQNTFFGIALGAVFQ